MASGINIKEENEKRYSRFADFGEMLFWSYANLQMLYVAVKEGKQSYDRMCYMIRAKAFKDYKNGKWQIHDLYEFNIDKIRQNDYCWYCGQRMEAAMLTKDHVFPRVKGGADSIDNIIMVCKTCNSSKGKMDLFEWFAEVRQEWPPINVLAHYLKNIYMYSIDNGLLGMKLDELDAKGLPFNWRYIPLDYPQPESLSITRLK